MHFNFLLIVLNFIRRKFGCTRYKIQGKERKLKYDGTELKGVKRIYKTQMNICQYMRNEVKRRICN
jgi:hypothetical protein